MVFYMSQSNDAESNSNSSRRVAIALACNARGDRFAPSASATFQRIISGIDTVSSKEGRKMVCVCVIAGSLMIADRLSGFYLKVAFGIAIHMQ